MSDDKPDTPPLFDRWGALPPDDPSRRPSPSSQSDVEKPVWVDDVSHWDDDCRDLARFNRHNIEEETDGWDDAPRKESDFKKLTKTWFWGILYHALHPVAVFIFLSLTVAVLDSAGVFINKKLLAVIIIVVIHLIVYVRLFAPVPGLGRSRINAITPGCVYYLFFYLAALLFSFILWSR